MSYTKTVWRNNQAPAINADNLNHIEQGIESAHNQMAINTSDIETLTTQVQGNASNIASEISARQSGDGNLQSQIDQIIAPSGEAPSAAEVENARIGASSLGSVTYDTLGNAIRGQVTDLKSDLNEITNVEVINFTKGAYINTAVSVGSTVDLTPVSNSVLAYAIADCSEGDVITLNAKGWSTGRLYAWLDSSNKLITVAGSLKEADGLRLVAPANTAKVVLNSYVADLKTCFWGSDYDYLVKSTADTDAELFAEIDDLTDGVAEIEFVVQTQTMTSGYYIASDGTITSAGSSYSVSDAVDISDYSILKITSRANYVHNIYAFYDSNNAFISGELANAGETSTAVVDKVMRVPSNAKYIRVSNYSNQTPLPSIAGKVISVKGFEALSGLVDDITTTETYQTDTIESVTYASGYVNKGGGSGSGDYVHTNKIPVNKGDRIYLVFAVSGNLGGFRFVTAYDASDMVVYASGAESTGTAGYTVPEGIKSVILSISGTDTSGASYNIHIVRSIAQNVIDTQSAKDVLFGKKWCVCGDSFSYGGQSVMPVFADGKYAGCRKVYPYFIGNRTHINIVDFTANGRTLAYPADGTFSNSLTNPSSDNYYQNIPADVDYITIYLGINDSHHAPGSGGGDGEDNTGEIPIGTVDDATTATFGGAWNVVLSWLITNRPKAHIGIIVSNGVDNINYRNLTIAIAKKYGIAYIDLNGDERTPAMIRPANNDIPASVKTALLNKWAVEVGVNTHPNTDAHEYESFFIENFLRSI